MFDKVPTFDWLDLHGKELLITVGVDKANGVDTTAIMGTDKNGKHYLLNLIVEDTGK